MIRRLAIDSFASWASLILLSAAALGWAQGSQPSHSQASRYDHTGTLLEWHVEQRSSVNSFSQRVSTWDVTVAEVESGDEIISVEVDRKPKREIKPGDAFQFRIVNRGRRVDLVCIPDPGGKHGETCGGVVGRRLREEG